MARYLRIFKNKSIEDIVDISEAKYTDYKVLDPTIELVPYHIINFPKGGRDKLYKIYKIVVDAAGDTYIWCFIQPIIDVTKIVEG